MLIDESISVCCPFLSGTLVKSHNCLIYVILIQSSKRFDIASGLRREHVTCRLMLVAGIRLHSKNTTITQRYTSHHRFIQPPALVLGCVPCCRSPDWLCCVSRAKNSSFHEDIKTNDLTIFKQEMSAFYRHQNIYITCAVPEHAREYMCDWLADSEYWV